MSTLITRDVNDINASDRAAIEHLLGQPLAVDQRVFVMAFASGGLAEQEIRAAARQRLTNVLAFQGERAANSAISSDEADAAVDEAMQSVRQRPQ